MQILIRKVLSLCHDQSGGKEEREKVILEWQ